MLGRLKLSKKMGELPFVTAIRRGLIITIPLLMVGSFALLLNALPVAAYQEFITSFAGGFLSNLFVFVNQVTFGILAPCIVMSISAAYLRQTLYQTTLVLCGTFATLGAFMILTGFFSDGFNIAYFGAQGMFTAIFCATVGSALYARLTKARRFVPRLYTVGANIDFNEAIAAILPVAVVVLAAFLFNQLIVLLFHAEGFNALFHTSVNALFDRLGNLSLKALLYVILSNFFWFFGIHGTNVLNSVQLNIFGAGTAVEAGLAGFLTKPVLDVFVLMGGSGTTISLLVAILLFSKQKNHRSLAKFATLPMLFNINEMLVFGLPIVFNGAFFIPFLVVPLVCIASSAVFLSTGIVPMPTNPVEWVTPIFINGYQSTGSIMGTLLQVFNIALGVLIYRWFLVRYERKTNLRMMQDMDSLVGLVKEAEEKCQPLNLMELRGREGGVAKMLAADLAHTLKAPEALELYYQPQYNNHDTCVGAEALLRWNHPRYGMIYPPLVIGIAGETGLLSALEQHVFTKAAADMHKIQPQLGTDFRVSVNVTALTLQQADFLPFMRALLHDNPNLAGSLSIELTEQMSFVLGTEMESCLTAIHNLGVELAVDDFSMGHTSLRYLQSNLFDMVKLDGSLVKDMMTNPRSEEIVASITKLSQTMHFEVLAEYVETREQRDKLERLGCNLYQGYLFSPAMPLEELLGIRQ